MANVYDIGDVVRLTGAFVSTGSTAITPTKVTIEYQTPGSTATVSLTSTSTSVVTPTTGTYYYDLLTTGAGVYPYRVYSTGTGTAAGENHFVVRHTLFD